MEELEKEQLLQNETDEMSQDVAAPVEQLPEHPAEVSEIADVPPQRKWQPQAMEIFQSVSPKTSILPPQETCLNEPKYAGNAASAAPEIPPIQPTIPPVNPQMQQPIPPVNPQMQQSIPPVNPQMQQSIPPVNPQMQQPIPPVNPQMQPPIPPVNPQMQPPIPPVNPQMQQPIPPVNPQMQRPIPPVNPQMQRPIPPVNPQAGHPWNPQPVQQNWYQNNQPQYSGWQMPPQVPPVQSKAPMTPEKKDRRAAFWLKIVAGLIALLLVYCIGSDIAAYRHGTVSTGTVPQSENAENTNDGIGAEVVIQQQKKPELNPDDEGVSEDGTYTVEGVAAAVRPSIVEIYTYGDSAGTLINGSGSGIILSEDGYIITNAHVLTDGKLLSVTMADEKEYTAEVVGSDAKTDLAVIKVQAKNLPAAVMGDSDEVVLGEAVVAIGNPAGLTGSVTNGIVSGLNRQIRSDSTGFDMNCIQTNAAISPGNSGGALVNMYGQVIGITSSKYVSSSYEGLGFAITINEVLPIVEDLIANGYVSDRVRVGITFASLENPYVQEEFADEIGLKKVPEDLTGVWITEIADDCDVASTKLAVNDVIVEVEGKDVMDYDTLCAAIEAKKANDIISAVCRRYDARGRYEEFTIQFHLMADTSGNY